MLHPSLLLSLLLLLFSPALSLDDCYNTKCVGTDANATTIDCDQSTNNCTVDETTGIPSCVTSPIGGQGVNCSHSDQFYCDYQLNGTAYCVVPPNHTCYDTLCVGHFDYENITLDCDQSDHRCVRNETGYPECVEGTRGHGSDCTGTVHLDYYCSINTTTGWAMCNQAYPSDCYSNLCSGTGDFENKTIDCDLSTKSCTVNTTTGEPGCTDQFARGAGVNCTGTAGLDFYCSLDADKEAICVEAYPSDCYASTCKGAGEFANVNIPCNQSTSHCALNGTNYPVCDGSARGAGVNCTLEELYHCKNDEMTGAAVCEYPPTYDCYDTKCVGTGEKANITIACDQSTHKCGVDATGMPTCEEDWRGGGVNCSHSDQYYCETNYLNGTAYCVVPPNHTCYDTLCVGHYDFENVSIDCDQSDHRCVRNETGYPECVEGTRGHGSDCTGTVHLDYYCSINTTTGWAMCNQAYPSDCYSNLCSGTGAHANTTIDCDLSTKSCTVNATTGEPGCTSEFARGSGVNCTGTAGLDFYCSVDATTAKCVQTPAHNCYVKRCVATDATSIPCDGASGRCGIEGGNLVCLNTSRGAGVDCNTTRDWFCGYTGAEFDPICLYSDAYDCFDTKCRGAGEHVESTIDCDQSKSRCGVDENGLPTCEEGKAGLGIMCGEGKWKCTSEKGTGRAICEHHRNMVGLWVVVGIVLVAVVVVAVWLWMRRRRRGEDRITLISREI